MQAFHSHFHCCGRGSALGRGSFCVVPMEGPRIALRLAPKVFLESPLSGEARTVSQSPAHLLPASIVIIRWAYSRFKDEGREAQGVKITALCAHP